MFQLVNSHSEKNKWNKNSQKWKKYAKHYFWITRTSTIYGLELQVPLAQVPHLYSYCFYGPDEFCEFCPVQLDSLTFSALAGDFVFYWLNSLSLTNLLFTNFSDCSAANWNYAISMGFCDLSVLQRYHSLLSCWICLNLFLSYQCYKRNNYVSKGKVYTSLSCINGFTCDLIIWGQSCIMFVCQWYYCLIK